MSEVNQVIVVTVKLFVTEQGQLNYLSLLNLVTGVRTLRGS